MSAVLTQDIQLTSSCIRNSKRLLNVLTRSEEDQMTMCSHRSHFQHTIRTLIPEATVSM